MKIKHICQNCGNKFKAYKNNKRKYCSYVCSSKARMGKPPWNKGKKTPKIVREKISKARMGKHHSNWKGGRNRDGQGYIYVYKPKHPLATKARYVMEHRLVMERILGRHLKPEEVVHHINGIKDDNRKRNLQLFENIGKHLSFHRSKRLPESPQKDFSRRRISFLLTPCRQCAIF